MSTSFFEKAGKKLFAKHLQEYAPVDPLYETYTDKRGRTKKRKRQLPPGLSARDAKILQSVKRRAHYLDKGFQIFGMRFGWTFVIGLIPGAGDVADAGLNYFLVVRKCQQAEIPSWLLQRMLLNNAASVIAGLIPVAGDVVLAAFKANSRNAHLLEEYLRIRGEEFLKLQAERQGGPSIAVPAADIQQVKPGAGRDRGEVVSAAPTSSAGPAQVPAAVPGGLAPGPTSSAQATTAVGGVTDPTGARPRNRSFMASWRGKEKAPQTGDRGRFVENVGVDGNGSSGSASGVNGKKRKV